MRKSQRFTIGAAVILFAMISVGLGAQDQKTSPDHEERAKAISVVRLINTAEVVYFSGSKKDAIEAHGHFGSWDELNQSGVVKTLESQWNEAKGLQLSTGAEVMPGWHLDLLVSADGKSWSIALHDKREGDGLFSVFSDSTGIIYLGAAAK
jgi:hypothetical protein